MTKIDPRYLKLHKKIYNDCLDERDPITINIILNNSSSTEAKELEAEVAIKLKQQIRETFGEG